MYHSLTLSLPCCLGPPAVQEIAPEYPPDLEHPEMSLEPVMLPQELGGDGGVLYEPELPSILKQRQQVCGVWGLTGCCAKVRRTLRAKCLSQRAQIDAGASTPRAGSGRATRRPPLRDLNKPDHTAEDLRRQGIRGLMQEACSLSIMAPLLQRESLIGCEVCGVTCVFLSLGHAPILL